MKKKLTDEEVEIEIERLRNTEAVKLAKAAEYAKNKRRQRMYQLVWLEKKGNEMLANGITIDDIKRQFADEDLLNDE